MALSTILTDLIRGVDRGTWRLCLRELQLNACQLDLVPDLADDTYALYAARGPSYGTIRRDGDGLWRLHR